MNDYEKLVGSLDGRGYDVDDDTMERVKEFAENLSHIEKHYGDWSEEDAQTAQGFVQSLRELADRGFEPWSEEDAQQASEYRDNLIWLNDNGWSDWSAEDAEQASEFVFNLKLLEELGEEATPDRMEEIAEFVTNLKLMRQQ